MHVPTVQVAAGGTSRKVSEVVQVAVQVPADGTSRRVSEVVQVAVQVAAGGTSSGVSEVAAGGGSRRQRLHTPRCLGSQAGGSARTQDGDDDEDEDLDEMAQARDTLFHPTLLMHGTMLHPTLVIHDTMLHPSFV